MTLSPRLQAIGRLIPPGSRVADVGTDHGYLPVWLIEHGISPFVIATDLHPGPLEAAKGSAKRVGIETGISFRLADGLEAVSPHEVDTVVVAGMGSETISGILDRTPWLKTGIYRIILQPQSKIPQLMDNLSAGGFRLTDQHLVEDGGKIYPIYEAEPGHMKAPQGGGRYVHPALIERGDPLLAAYLTEICNKLTRALGGLEQGGGETAEKQAEFALALRELRAANS